ncbi:metalloprotease TIKI1-like [Oncorhynchus keta]|uniref:metalloprotease TIKI1-like n=1 Tax=Oncorhynchus keta TaxID=8018 RepID=UPI00227A548F|nr:metalloprotease TIKI1-like [Oncorhynchus keta]
MSDWWYSRIPVSGGTAGYQCLGVQQDTSVWGYSGIPVSGGTAGYQCLVIQQDTSVWCRSISAPDQTGHSLGQNLDESPDLEPFLHELHDEEQQHPLQDNPLPSIPRHSPSLELMDTTDRKLKKKRRNKQRKHQRNGQFNDLWVRIEESTTVESPPPLVRLIHGYITVRPHHHDHQRGHAHARANYNRLFSGSSASTPLCVSWLLFTVLGHIWTL